MITNKPNRQNVRKLGFGKGLYKPYGQQGGTEPGVGKITGSVDTDTVSDGTLYTLADSSAADPPAGTVKANAQATQAVTANTTQNVTINVTLPNGTYYLHYVQETTGGFSNVITSPPFSVPSTPAAPVYVTYTSGVAPLGVWVSTLDQDVDRSFSALFNTHYHWDYGDPGSGMHETGQSRNASVGITGGHVYDTPGVYTITMTPTTSDGAQTPTTVEITVTDPDVVYAGTETVAISTSGDFTGAPAGATQLTSSDSADIVSNLNAGRRVVLKRGETWAVASTMSITGDDAYLGAYGTGISENVNGSFANDPILASTDNNPVYLATPNRLRIAHVQIINNLGNDETTGGIIWSQGADEGWIIYRCQLSNGRNCLLMSGGSQVHQKNAFCENRLTNPLLNNMYFGGDQMLVIGNHSTDPRTSHNNRCWAANQMVYNCNYVTGASVDTADGRQLLKYHSPEENTGNTDRRSKYSTLWGNVFGAGGPWPVLIGPSTGGDDSQPTYNLIEANRFYAGLGTQSSVLVKQGFSMFGSYNMIRNNVMDGSGASTVSAFEGYVVMRRGAGGTDNSPIPTGNVFYNNTNQNLDAGATSFGVHVSNEWSPVPEDTTVINTFTNLSAATTSTPLQDDGVNTVASNNVDNVAPGFIDSTNLDFLLRDYDILVGSPAINQGANVPVWKDFAGTSRPFNSTYDLGAYEFDG